MYVQRNLARVLFLLLLLDVSTGWAQPTLERFAYTNLQKGKWSKSRAQLQKAMRKDSINSLAQYVLSLYYFKPGNPDFNIDSAYTHALISLSDFQRSAVRQRDRMKRFPLDSGILITHREKIDSSAFQRAKSLNTEKSYVDFITNFPFAAQRNLAAELRDEVAYIDALKDNTYQSFLLYLEKYPASTRAPEATARYHKLLFETKTRDKKLTSYEQFLKEHPETPYRREVELQVFEISTASGSRKSVEDFIRRYPQSVYSSKAKNILYYIIKEKDEAIPSWLLTDSLRKIRQLEQSYLVPFYRDGRLGFMNASGKEILAPHTDELSKDYLCGNIVEDVLVSRNKIVARNGETILESEIDEVEDLGYGFLGVTGNGCLSVVHKTGFSVSSNCLSDAVIVGGGRLFALKEKNIWVITTLTGRLLYSGADEVTDFGEVVGIKSNNTIRLCTVDELSKAADQHNPTFTRTYNEIKKWDDVLWLRSGENQGLVDFNLRELIPLQRQEISPAFFGGIASSTGGTKIWQKGKPATSTFSGVKVSEPWITVEQNKKWYVFDRVSFAAGGRAYDSVYFIGPVLVGSYSDSLSVHFEPYNFIELPNTAKVSFLPGKDSVFYISVEMGSGKTIYNSKGVKLFNTDFDRVTYAGENLFIGIKNEKRGVLSAQGKPVLPAEYDGVGNLQNGIIPVLKDKKFGMVDLNHRKLIKPEYEKNIIPYNSNYLIAFKGNAFGLIGWDNKPVLPFEYEEVRYWSDSTALLKKNFQWILYNFIEKKKIVDRIREFRWICDSDTVKILIIRQDNHYGVIHNRKGYILPATYTDIINLGSVAQPLYFTEKFVEEASIYVVIYYDSNGKLLRRQVFEEDDYDKIYCSHN